MRRFLFLACFFFARFSFAQCPPGDVELHSQSDVEVFVATYPNCTQILGSLIISSESEADPIVNLSTLSNLTGIVNTLKIGDLEYYDAQLDSLIPGNLGGLASLTVVGSIDIGSPLTGGADPDKIHIESLLPLENLMGEMGVISLRNTVFYDKLPDFEAVTSLESFDLTHCNGVTQTPRFQGLQHLTAFYVFGEDGVVDSLATIHIPNQIEEIGFTPEWAVDMQILRNNSLTEIVGGQNLVTIDRLVIGRNESLTDLPAFDQLEEIYMLSLNSCNNQVFDSFRGLERANRIFLTYSADGSFDFPFDNPCEQYAEELNIRIGEEAEGLVVSGQSDVLYPGFHIVANNVGNLNITSNLKKTAQLRIDTRNVDAISGFATLDSIYSSEGFNNLSIIAPSYPHLPSFDNLTHIEGDIFIELDTLSCSLLNLEGLGSLQTLNGNLWIEGNNEGIEQPFESLDGLSSLLNINKTVRLTGLTNLEDISGLQNASHIYQIRLDKLPELELDFSFANLTSFERLYLKQTGATTLPDLNDVTFLHSVYLNDNSYLQDTDGLSNISELNRFTSINNPQLSSIVMADNVVLNENLILNENPSLAYCGQSLTICSMVNTAEQVELSGNGEECNTVQQILNACNGTSVGLADATNRIETSAVFTEFGNLEVRTDAEGQMRLMLVDIQGRILKNQIVMFDEGFIQLELSEISPGVYTIVLIDDQKKASLKVVKVD